VKYFSGTATYVKTIQAPASWFRPGQRLKLDLGPVRDIAEGVWASIFDCLRRFPRPGLGLVRPPAVGTNQPCG
jgi:hypothetical protein